MVYKISIVQCIITCNFNLLLPKWFLSLNFFFIFPLFLTFSFQVLNGFPICSQWVPNVFSKGVPNSTSLYSHVFCPKSSPSHLCRWAKGGGGTPTCKESSILGSLHSFNFVLQWANPKKQGWTCEPPPTNLSMKEGSLFCFVTMRSTK
jgi:hypothetical protein